MKGRWIHAKYRSRCIDCSHWIEVGDRIWWYRAVNLAYCASCGRDASIAQHNRKMDKKHERSE